MSDDNDNNDSECDLPEIPQQKLKAFNDFEEENIKKRNEIVDEYILGLDNKKESNKNEETDEDDNDPFSSAAIKKLKKIKKEKNKQNENNFLKRHNIKSEQGKRKNLFDSLGTTNYKLNDKKKFTENYYFNKFDNNKTYFTPQEINNNYNLFKKSNSKSKSKEKKIKNNSNNFIPQQLNKRNNTAKQLPRKNNNFNSIINNNINMNQIIYSNNNYNNNIIYNPIINNNFNNNYNNINQKKFFYNILNDQNNYFNINNLDLNKKELKEQLNQINKMEKIKRENQLENVYNLPKNILSHINNNKFFNEVRKDIIEDSIEEEDDITRKDKEIEFPLIYKYFK